MISPSLSIIPDCFAAPIKVPIESNMFTREKLTTSIATVRHVSTGFFPENMPPKSMFRKETSAKSLNFAPIFISNADSFVTPRGIPAIVAAAISNNMEPFTLRE